MCHPANNPFNPHLIKSGVNKRPCCAAPSAQHRPQVKLPDVCLAVSTPVELFCSSLLLFALSQTVLKKPLCVQQFKVGLINNTPKSAGTPRGAKVKHLAERSEENGFSQHDTAGGLLA